MTASFIHTAFDPIPYVVFSFCSIAMGVLLEVGWPRAHMHDIRRFFPSNATHHAVHLSDPTGL